MISISSLRSRWFGGRDSKPTELYEPRSDARTYVMNGDNVWGDSITWAGGGKRPDDSHHGRAMGWVTPKPQRGDVIYVPMASKRWGTWIVQSVEHARGVDDMFYAEVCGAVGYADERGDEPRGKYATELISSGVFR